MKINGNGYKTAFRQTIDFFLPKINIFVKLFFIFQKSCLYIFPTSYSLPVFEMAHKRR